MNSLRNKIVWLLAVLSFLSGYAFADTVNSQLHRIKVTTVTAGLEHPWSVAFLPNGRKLVTERPGRLRLIDKDGHLNPNPIQGLPKISASGQGGLLDVVLHPDYKNQPWIYFSYVAAGAKGVGTEVARAQLKNHRLVQLQRLFRMQPKSRGGRHFGSRLAFDNKGYLYISLGDRGERPSAQDLNDHRGSLIRLHADGRIPQDNPFVGQTHSHPEIYSYGHRNMQGLAFHPQRNEIWSHEHGPQGGDELNRIQAGGNYGWPVITYGVNYVIGTKIGEGVSTPGMEQPLHYWAPKSIAPSGMAFYNGNQFPQWQGQLFIGALRDQMLVRLKLDGSKVINEEHLFKRRLGRIRDVRNGPDGYLYLLTDSDEGRLLRLEPAD